RAVDVVRLRHPRALARFLARFCARRRAMNLLLVGGSYKTMPIELREKLAFDGLKLSAALNELASRFGCEAAIVSTCNRVEIYVARSGAAVAPSADLVAEFIAQARQIG